jgi:hypothetical protein
METTVFVIAIVSGIVAAVTAAVGFDPRKRLSWLFVVCGFIFGFFLAGGIVAGTISGLLTLWGGNHMHKVRKRFRE